MRPGIRIADAHNSFSFRKHERNPFSVPIPDPLPLSRQTLQSQPAAEELSAMPNEQIVPRRRHLRRPRRTLRDRRLYSARKINYGRRGELFAGFVALSSLVTFNLLAGINLILLYSPRRPDPFALNLGGLNHFFLPRLPSSTPPPLLQLGSEHHPASFFPRFLGPPSIRQYHVIVSMFLS